MKMTEIEVARLNARRANVGLPPLDREEMERVFTEYARIIDRHRPLPAATPDHLVVCMGCGARWADSEDTPCSCLDSEDPNYERWIIYTREGATQ